MADDLDVTGWILWREATDSDPTFRYGTLRVENAAVTFRPRHPSKRPDNDSPSGDADPRSAVGLRSRTGELYVVPGFVDMHSHLAIGKGPLTSDQIRNNAWTEIRAGVLAMREPGSPVKVSPGELPYGRPIVVSSGRHVAIEKRYNRGLAIELPDNRGEGPIADRTQLIAAEVRRQASAGDGWVKIVGDWIDRSDGEESTLSPLWTREELGAAVASAHDVGARVAVHTFSPDSIDDILAAGVDSIEHGTGMTRQQMDRARDRGIVVVPTLIQVLKFPEFAASATRYPEYARAMTDLYRHRRQWFADLLDSGIQLFPGSDAGGYQAHGAVIDEMGQLATWGMAPEDVLAAATWKARDYLGLQSLSDGAPADCVIFDADPRLDPQVWSSPIAVMAAGHLIDARGGAPQL